MAQKSEKMENWCKFPLLWEEKVRQYIICIN